MKKIYLLFVTIVLIGVQLSNAQNVVTNQIIVCSGGSISDPNDFVTIASVVPETGITSIFDTIYTQSVQDIIIENGIAYVAAQDSIVKYDLNTYSRLAEVEALGVHKLAVRKDVLIATFWYPVTSGFVKTYLLSDLSPVFTFEDVSDEADGIYVFPGDLYTVVAVPGGWSSTTGKMAWLDLDQNTFVTEANMNDYGIGVSYFVNYHTGFPNYAAITKTPWGGTTFYSYGFTVTGEPTGTYEYNGVMQGYTGQENTILFAQINDGIGQIDLENNILDENLIVEPSDLTIASSVYDSVSNLFYVCTTDYFSTGLGTIYDIDGNKIGEFEAEISPEAIAIDYRLNTAIAKNINSNITVFPNPSNQFINIINNDSYDYVRFKIIDFSGRIIIEDAIQNSTNIKIDISKLNNGFYVVNLIGNNQLSTSTFIKN